MEEFLNCILCWLVWLKLFGNKIFVYIRHSFLPFVALCIFLYKNLSLLYFSPLHLLLSREESWETNKSNQIKSNKGLTCTLPVLLNETIGSEGSLPEVPVFFLPPVTAAPSVYHITQVKLVKIIIITIIIIQMMLMITINIIIIITFIVIIIYEIKNSNRFLHALKKIKW